MANEATLQYLQDEIQLRFDGDNSTPVPTDPEWLVRLSFINAMVRRWNNVDGVYWKQLWTSLAAGSPGSPGRTTIAAQTAYTAPSDMLQLGGFVRLTDVNNQSTYLQIVKLEEVQLHDGDNLNAFAYVTGNPWGGQSVNINPAPTAANAGQTIHYDYYKKATRLSATTDILEMSNPEYAINGCISQLYQQQRDLTRAQNYLADAEDALNDMQAENMFTPPWAGDEHDISNTWPGGGGFGK